MEHNEVNLLAAAPEAAELDDLGELIKEFLVESYENLDQLDRDLITLEQDPHSQATLASIFRTIHTIKGTCGFFGYTKLEAVTHVGESLLSRLRDGQLQFNSERATGLLALVDAVREMLGNIEADGEEGNGEYAALIEQLKQLQQPSVADSAPLVAPAVSPVVAAVVNVATTSEPEALPPAPPVVVPPAVSVPVALPLVEEAALTAAFDLANGAPALATLARQTSAPVTREVEVLPALPPEAAKSQALALSDVSDNGRGRLADNSIRVDVGLLDVLMNLVGELVLARNQILQYTSTHNDASFAATSQRLNLITTELQEGVMKTRMQPIGNVWSKFPRVVRDLALACNKKINLVMEGKETELDKTIIEAIKDPLTHIVRNSCDHGIEMPEVRLANSKPAEGCISLHAYHEGGQVNIEISDDGAGINLEKVKQRALQRGLIGAEQAARMSEREALHLIFMPGFSTAEKVTNLSGRGVGMDVVKTHIEKIGGTVDIHSKVGQGSTIKIKIPLTLAIIPALIITSAGDRYAIPQVSLLELVRLDGEQALNGIELIYGTPVYRLRGNLLPLVYLNRELQVEARGTQSAGEAINIVVLRADDRSFGLVVDEINDTEEIVVKPLGQQLKGITCFAGATIMGDGKVALILDVMGLAQHACVVSEVRDRALTEAVAQEQEKLEQRQTLLLFRLGQQGRMAIPLSQVARLEEFPAAAVEQAWQQEVVQYRGQIMPLLRLADLFQYSGAEALPDQPLQVIVYSQGEHSVGLVVDQILDIVEEEVHQQHRSVKPGVLGTAVIQQRVTDLLDVESLVRTYARDSLAYDVLANGNQKPTGTYPAALPLGLNAQAAQLAALPALAAGNGQSR